MHDIILAFHNIVRWVVLILGIFALGRALRGWFGNKSWSKTERKIGVFFTSAVDLQLLLGVLLYFVTSPWGIRAIIEKGMSFVMGHGEFRFFAIEHVITMVLGVVFAHLGSALPKKVEDSRQKFKRTAFWFGLAILIIFAGIPWSRPLFPS